MNPPYDVAQVLNKTGPILLDFDGPICSIFATLAAVTVAIELRATLAEQGVNLPPSIQATKDPLEILRFTASLDNPAVTRLLEDELCRAELAAVTGAGPTPYAREVIVAAYDAGRPVAIVSNNSAPAIERYLTDHRFTRYISAVSGRPYADPAGMKPNPEPILFAVRALHASPSDCVLIGDSTSDIEGGRAAGVRTIGFANRPEKRSSLIKAGADAVAHGADGMADVARALHPDDEQPQDTAELAF